MPSFCELWTIDEETWLECLATDLSHFGAHTFTITQDWVSYSDTTTVTLTIDCSGFAFESLPEINSTINVRETT
jgi:hypothetical protein